MRGEQVLREHGGLVPVHAVRQGLRRLRRRRARQLRKVRRRTRQEQGQEISRDCTMNLTGEDSVTGEIGSFHRLQNFHR